jgi:hypothetical protein
MFSKVKHCRLVVNYGQMFYNIGPILKGLEPYSQNFIFFITYEQAQ